MSPNAQQGPVWELSSFSEAAMAAAQPTSMLPDPPLSQPRRGSTAPTFDLHALLDPQAAGAGMSLKAQQGPVWELSSFSEAAIASAQPTSMLPDPPLSQPRWGSTAPTFDLHAHLDPHAPESAARSSVGAVELQRCCDGGSTADIDVAVLPGLDSSHIRSSCTQ